MRKKSKCIVRLFLCVELCCSCWAPAVFASYSTFYDVRNSKEMQLNVADALLGFRPQANIVTRVIKRADNGEILFSAVYSIDSFNRRAIPAENNAMRNSSMIFFGCSLMFGEGVNDNETFPYYLAQLMPGYMPYNYGYLGYGPQAMLAKLQNGDVFREVKEKHAMGFYLFIDNHVNRAIGSLQIAGNWGHDMPYYAIDENNRLVRRGSFYSGRHFSTMFYQWLMQNELLKRWINGRDFPPITDSHVLFTCRIIEESRNEFKKQFNSDDFYVILYSRSAYASSMMRYFTEKGIKCLDYHNVDEFLKEGFSFKHEGHPTPIAFKFLANMVARDIKLEEYSRHQ